jgi:hypothetical protein
MELQTAKRKQAKIKMALQGPSGSGKTMSALLIAYGLCGSWSDIGVIDSENGSSHLYAHLGSFKVVNITSPFTPEKYIQALKICENAGLHVIIIDSLSHEWDGAGGILDIHSSMPGNSFTNWAKLTPRHNLFVQALLQSPAHIISTIRSKQEYVLSEKNGKQVPEKVGLKGVTRDNMDYEFTIVLDINIKHFASASKDRTGLFMDKPEFRIDADTGALIRHWCDEGQVPQHAPDFSQRINECKSFEELTDLYYNNPEYQQSHLKLFSHKKQEFKHQSTQFNASQNHATNGYDNY